MKSKWIGGLLIFLFIFIGCNAQISNKEQQLVGTWVSVIDEDNVIVFNSNGTSSFFGDNIRYGAADNKIVIIYDRELELYEYFVSTDGKTLILFYDTDRPMLLRKRS
jgi:hypothetical protein